MISTGPDPQRAITHADGPESVLLIGQTGLDALTEIFAPHALQVVLMADVEPIPGSHWGEPEAGLIGQSLYVRRDTPVHSALHEACHWLLMSPVRRSQLHTDAKGTQAEEMAVCYLQICLADRIPGMGRQRMWRDMDAWGYNFMLGSARRWFVEDAADAVRTLEPHWHRWPGLLGSGVES